MKELVKISKEDAMYIREHYPNVHIRMTNKQAPARKHTYYCEESRAVMRYLAQKKARLMSNG